MDDLWSTQNNDAEYDPLCATPVGWPEQVIPLNLNTVGHSDVDVIQGANGTWRMAYVAQGRRMVKSARSNVFTPLKSPTEAVGLLLYAMWA